jgi:hypothetical protein
MKFNKKPKPKQTEVRHSARKATPEQVEAMNRELELRGARIRYKLKDGRLVQTGVSYSRECW